MNHPLPGNEPGRDRYDAKRQPVSDCLEQDFVGFYSEGLEENDM